MDWVLGRTRGRGAFYRGNEEYFLDVITIHEDRKVDFCGGELQRVTGVGTRTWSCTMQFSRRS